MQVPHSSQRFEQRAQRQARYRGYDILMQRRDLCWMATQSEREALAQARRRVDHALASG
jgi:hypothetical protein